MAAVGASLSMRDVASTFARKMVALAAVQAIPWRPSCVRFLSRCLLRAGVLVLKLPGRALLGSDEVSNAGESGLLDLPQHCFSKAAAPGRVDCQHPKLRPKKTTATAELVALRQAPALMLNSVRECCREEDRSKEGIP